MGHWGRRFAYIGPRSSKTLGFAGGGARGNDCGDEQQAEKSVKRILEVVGSSYHRQGLDTTGCLNNLSGCTCPVCLLGSQAHLVCIFCFILSFFTFPHCSVLSSICDSLARGWKLLGPSKTTGPQGTRARTLRVIWRCADQKTRSVYPCLSFIPSRQVESKLRQPSHFGKFDLPTKSNSLAAQDAIKQIDSLKPGAHAPDAVDHETVPKPATQAPAPPLDFPTSVNPPAAPLQNKTLKNKTMKNTTLKNKTVQQPKLPPAVPEAPLQNETVQQPGLPPAVPEAPLDFPTSVNPPATPLKNETAREPARPPVPEAPLDLPTSANPPATPLEKETAQEPGLPPVPEAPLDLPTSANPPATPLKNETAQEPGPPPVPQNEIPFVAPLADPPRVPIDKKSTLEPAPPLALPNGSLGVKSKVVEIVVPGLNNSESVFRFLNPDAIEIKTVNVSNPVASLRSLANPH